KGVPPGPIPEAPEPPWRPMTSTRSEFIATVRCHQHQRIVDLDAIEAERVAVLGEGFRERWVRADCLERREVARRGPDWHIRHPGAYTREETWEMREAPWRIAGRVA
ncbi:MAG TPA: hypothetical protein VFH61_05700, partial [Thermoleophilia bacterium]|nr:hypothetical protein [Thermoleophilia bacterium]